MDMLYSLTKMDMVYSLITNGQGLYSNDRWTWSLIQIDIIYFLYTDGHGLFLNCVTWEAWPTHNDHDSGVVVVIFVRVATLLVSDG